MDRENHIWPRLAPDAFAGTAAYYVRYRVPYPERLIRDLLNRVPVADSGLLLDLACGPGRLGLDLASSFREVWAIDLEPEMIEAGRQEAVRRGVGNIRWMVGRAEDLAAPPAAFDLIVIGEAFHRLDQPLVARQALQWLKPGGGLATLGNFSILSGREPWQRVVLDVLPHWTGCPPKAAGEPEPQRPGIGPDHDEGVMRAAGFQEVGSHPWIEPQVWTIEAILGYLYSTSVCSRAVLSARVAAFESDLRTALLAHDPGGTYRENTQWGYTFGRKPRAGEAALTPAR